MAVTALSMTVTPLLMLFTERVLLPRFAARETGGRESDVIEERHPVIIAGFSHFGSTIGRFLRANGVNATILDNNTDQVDLLRKMGFKVYYGDATRHDLLLAAGAEDARLLVIAIDSPETNLDLVETVQKHFPHLEILVRARNRTDAYELMDLGVQNIYREHLESSVRLGVDVLKKLGRRAFTATRAGQAFIRYDEAALLKLAAHRHDQKQYIFNVRQQIRLQEELLRNDLLFPPVADDHAWDTEDMRERVIGNR
jgi:CPA2 family monovalent cation:H+ antiporter-2